MPLTTKVSSPESSLGGSAISKPTNHGSWFPPATFQLRIRSLKSILFNASNKIRGSHHKGRFSISLHHDPESEPFWNGKELEWWSDRQDRRLQWSDIDLEKAHVHLSSGSVVVKVWFTSPDGQSKELEQVAGVYFSGLEHLGNHLPSNRRLIPDSLVFGLGGSYYCPPVSKLEIKRSVFIHTEDVGHTYPAGLLLRLHRMQRALHRQETSNNRIKKDLAAKGVLDPNAIDKRLSDPDIEKEEKARSLRDQVLQTKRPKSTKIRMTETQIKLKIEDLSVRLDLLRQELENRMEMSKIIKNAIVETSCQNSAKSEELKEDLEVIRSKEAEFKSWKAEFRTKLINGGLWARALKEARLNMLRGFMKIYPISDLDGKAATIRWVCLPDPGASLKEYSSKNEVAVTVATGWLAHLLHLISSVLDVPMRYPVRLLGSHSYIQDRSKSYSAESDIGEFPLFVKGNNDWSRFEYGIYLLAKDVGQIRLMFGKSTKDLRRILANLHNVIELGKSNLEMSKIIKMLPELQAELANPPPVWELKKKETLVEVQEGFFISSSESESSISSDCEVGVEAKEDHLFLGSSPSNEGEASPSSGSDSTGKPEEQANSSQTEVEPEQSDTFWREATSQSMALISNPSNFQRSRVGGGSSGNRSNKF